MVEEVGQFGINAGTGATRERQEKGGEKEGQRREDSNTSKRLIAACNPSKLSVSISILIEDSFSRTLFSRSTMRLASSSASRSASSERRSAVSFSADSCSTLTQKQRHPSHPTACHRPLHTVSPPIVTSSRSSALSCSTLKRITNTQFLDRTKIWQS